MTEDFNEGPIVIEDKQSLLTEKEKCCLCGNETGLMECGDCGFKFCNEIHENNQSDIFYHFKNSNHNILKVKTNKNYPNKYEVVKCCKCSNNNSFSLFVVKNKENSEDFRKKIFCNDHKPKTDNILHIIGKEEKTNYSIKNDKNKKKKSNINNVDKERVRKNQKLIKEFNEAATRKLNKVKLKYDNKYDYYQIYKPLIVADYLYTKQIYDNKNEYDINLLVTKNERYYFQIPEDFIEINFDLGRVLKFIEVDKNKKKNEKEKDEDHEPFQFVGVVTNLYFNEDAQLYDIWIMPINKHITTLKGHTGSFKIKEEFCKIPYTRMLDALDLFQSDENDDENGGAVSLNLVRRILGQYPTKEDIDKKNSEVLENFEMFKKKEERDLCSLFDDKNSLKIETSIDNYGELNESQISSIKNVFSNVLNLIQGPPGTGKTFLSSFIIYNIFKKRKNKSDKILLCSPSNAATDNLALALIKINKVIKGKMKILRVFAKSRECLNIEDELLNISLHKKLAETEDFDEIEKEDLQEAIEKITGDVDIVIATCSTSWDERINKLNFPFVLIDEVTQCCEIEALIPIVHGCQHLTLIGDQKQLGPIVLHPKAESTGMKISLFERMLKLYPELLNLLNIQYRMHEEIIKFPSQEFYENKIVNAPSILNRINEKINLKFIWPNKKIPLMFINVIGKEIIIKSGKSKQNEEEATIVSLFIDKLKNLGINFNDIGIITPYAAQKNLIQTKLKEKYKNEMENLKISSVDGFQGREKDFIILSNVRSNQQKNIGFLKDLRRLNVSITRAKYGMIIVGNAQCLYDSDKIWRKYINYYMENDLLVQPFIKKDIRNEKIIAIDIEKLEKANIIEDEKMENENSINFEEYDFDASENQPDINEDLLNNFECSENVYKEGNKKYYKKKKEKKNKKKNKKKNNYYNKYN